LLQIQKIK